MRIILIWLIILPLAILNGGLREYVFVPLLGRHSLPVSGLILCLLIFLLAILFRNFMRLSSLARSLAAGVIWLCLTVVFETGLGLAQGISVNALLAMYDIRTGNFWLFVILSTMAAPVVSYRLHR